MTSLIYVAMHGVHPTNTAFNIEDAQTNALRAEKQRPGALDYDYLWLPQKTDEWRLLRKPKGRRLLPAEKTGRRIVAVAFTPDEKTIPVDGPFPVKVRATPSGAELDISAYLFQAVFSELISKADDDPEGLVSELTDMAALMRSAVHAGRNSHARHEFDERMDQLLKEFAGEGLIPVYGDQVTRLRDRLAEIAAPRPLPGQQARRTA
jgi:hypothetical protein